MVFASLGAGGLLIYQHAHRVAPAICVEVQEDGGMSGGGSFLPAVDGYLPNTPGRMSSSGTSARPYQLSETYKVTASSPGHLFVLAHYVIDRDGTRKEVDRALPVTKRTNNPADWIKLDDHLSAYAYQAAGTISY